MTVTIETAVVVAIAGFVVGFLTNLLAMQKMFTRRGDFEELKKLLAESFKSRTEDRQKEIESLKYYVERQCDTKREACEPLKESISQIRQDIRELFALMRDTVGKMERIIGSMEKRNGGNT